MTEKLNYDLTIEYSNEVSQISTIPSNVYCEVTGSTCNEKPMHYAPKCIIFRQLYSKVTSLLYKLTTLETTNPPTLSEGRQQ